MDSIEIRGLACRCIIGIRARERRVSQRVQLDLELGVELERAGKSGRIAHTVDYSRASTEIIALLQFRRYLLLEVAAEECAGWLFAAYGAIRSVGLRIAKPQALAGQAESGGVRIIRQRPPEATRQPTPFGFIEPQLETAEASIALVGVNSGKSFSLSELGFDSALALPLTGRLVSARPLLSHEPAQLSSQAGCTNQDGATGLLVICGQRAVRPRFDPSE
jgi:7,8-dihydroneopterin aldolase/epimerase/oxygenase